MSPISLDPLIPDTKLKLLNVAVMLMQRQGYTATTVDQICQEAGLTKGSFFHYFKYKEEIAEAAMAQFFNQQSAAMTTPGGFGSLADPLARLHGFLDYFVAVAHDDTVMKSCLIGNLTQEIAMTHPAIQVRSEACFAASINAVATILRAAKEAYPPAVDFNPDATAAMLIAVIQGSMILAKARQSGAALASNIEEFRVHVNHLFGRKRPATRAPSLD